ncbi:MAG: D-alanine--D-alanine ligase [Legionellales bacterium]|nr:D-alanine--D-alanine ligase [Legionellales bacterium]
MKNNHDFGRVGVLMGGLSLERQVSLNTGEAVYKALLKKNVDAVKIDWNEQIDIIKTLINANLDMVFIALHGKGGEDGNIQAILNVLKIPYTGSGVKSSAMMMDKIVTKQLLIAHGINTPKFVLMPEDYVAKEVIGKLKLPLVVKPIADGSSQGVTIVHSENELSSAWQEAYACGSGVFAEEMIHGTEISVGILGDTVLPSVKIVSSHEFYDYSSKYFTSDNKYVIPSVSSPELEKDIQSICLQVYRLGYCRGWCRIDGILDSRNIFYIIDVNTIPGLTETSLIPKESSHVGMNFEDVVIKILSSASID